MSVPLSAADVLAEHVVFELDCIDRMYCNAYVRKLTYPGGVASFFTHHRGATFASTALADPISKQFVASIHRFAAEREIPVVRFEKGQRKDDVAHEHLAGLARSRGSTWSGWRRRRSTRSGPRSGATPRPGRATRGSCAATALVNQYYLLRPGRRLRPVLYQVLQLLPVRGAAVLQRPSLGPTPSPRRPGSRSASWTTGFSAARTRPRLQRICDRLSAAKIDAFFRKWLARLPHPAGTVPQRHDRRTGHLRPQTIAHTRPDLPHPAHQPLPPHRRRAPRRPGVHPNPHPATRPRARRRQRPPRGLPTITPKAQRTSIRP